MSTIDVGGHPDTEVITTTAGFAALEHEWDDLHRNAPDAWPHESWAFLFSWWEHCGGPFRLRLLVLRDPAGGQLVGVVPLMIERRGRVRTLVYLVDNEPLDVLARQGWAAAVEAVLPGALRALPGWDVAELRPVRPGARIWRAYERWRGPREHRTVTDYAFVAARPEDEVLGGLTRKNRKNLFRTLRHAHDDGVRSAAAPARDATAAGARLVALHRELWAGRQISASHASEEWARFLAAAVGRLLPRGLADVVEWRRDGRVEVSQLYLYGPAAVHAYQVGATRYALERLQWSALYIHEGLALARARGVADLDLAYGGELYKARWNPRAVPHSRIRLGRGPRGYAFFALAALRAASRRFNAARSRRRAARRSPAPSRARGA